MSKILNENILLADGKHKALYEKWGKRINLVERAMFEGNQMDIGRKASLAKVLENTSNFIRYQLTEATQSSAIGQYKRAALDMVAAVVPNLIANDLVSVQALDNRIGMVNYIEYIYGNTKGSTKGGTTFASTLNLHAVDKDFTSRLVKSEAHVAQSAITTLTLDWMPVLPGTLKLVKDTGGVITILEERNGMLFDVTNDAVIANSSVEFGTGVVTFGALTIAVNDVLDFTYQYNNEFIAPHDIPEIQLKLTSIPLEAKARRLKAYFAFEANYELQKEYGQDAQQLLNATAAGEIMREIDAEICFDLYNNAGAGPELIFSRTLPVGVSMIDHYDSFAIKLEEGSAQINQATRKVSANFVVLGTQAAVIARSVRAFVPSGVKAAIGPYFLGTIGNLRLYVQPEFDVDAFLLGYKGDSLFDAGYVYAPYMPIMTTDMVQLEDMGGRKGWATMYATSLLNDRMYAKGRITA